MDRMTLLRDIADLMTEPGSENPEYDRACVEIAQVLLGGDFAKEDVAAFLRILKEV